MIQENLILKLFRRAPQLRELTQKLGCSDRDIEALAEILEDFALGQARRQISFFEEIPWIFELLTSLQKEEPTPRELEWAARVFMQGRLSQLVVSELKPDIVARMRKIPSGGYRNPERHWYCWVILVGDGGRVLDKAEAVEEERGTPVKQEGILDLYRRLAQATNPELAKAVVVVRDHLYLPPGEATPINERVWDLQTTIYCPREDQTLLEALEEHFGPLSD